MRYKARAHTRKDQADIMGVCKRCKEPKPLRWVKHKGRKGGGYYASVCRECKAKAERERRKHQRITNESVIKTCKQCGLDNPHRWISDSRNANGGYYQSICLVCHTDSVRYHWHEIKKKCVEFLGGKCIDCGLQEGCVSVYDLHHRDPLQKDFNFGSLVKGKRVRQFDELVPELMKCELLCSNCHRKRHSRYECCRRH